MEMASKKSPSKVELVAIYRLEFYKKQKNWKFCKDVCKKKNIEPTKAPEECQEPVQSSNSSKTILNKTYYLDPETVPSDINDAFLESDSDKILPATPPDCTDIPHLTNIPKSISEPKLLDAEWPEPCQDWPATQNQWQELQKLWPESQYQWLETEKQYHESQKQWQDSPQLWPDYTGADRVWSLPEVPVKGWQTVGQKWGGEEVYYPHDAEPPRAYEDTAWPDVEPCTQAYSVLGAAEAWLGGAPGWPEQEEVPSSLSRSAASFLRGAAAAPHSSELELSLTPSDTSLSSVTAGLSTRALVANVRRHTAALATLLNETRARAAGQHKPPSTLDCAMDLTCEDLPTRDIDLFHPQKDPFVAGSFKNEPGRGRGRLQRERLIGIGLGRPYRL